MNIENIINNLNLINNIIPDYVRGRRMGLSDEESENLPMKAIEEAIEILEENKWIPISEKLPKYNKPVLFLMENDKGETKQVVGYLFHTDKENFKAFNDEFAIDINMPPEFLVKEFVKAWKKLS